MDTKKLEAKISQIADELGVDEGHVLDELIAGRLHMLGRMGEQSRILHENLRSVPQIGVSVMTGEEDGAPEIAETVSRALGGLGEPESINVQTYDVGVGAGAVVVVVTVTAGLISILANAPKAAANVKAWANAARKAFASTNAEALTMETLKLICVDNVLDEHKGVVVEPDLISSSMCVTPNPDTDEEMLHGPAYVIVPVPEASLTYVFTIDWSGEILHRATMPYAGPSADELANLKEYRALRVRSD